MTSIILKSISKSFGPTKAVDNVSLEIKPGELFFLLGPSGCGKTTVLRLVAGFYQPDSGAILFGERDITTLPPQKRNTGMVFQNYALWPHLTVFQNVEYGLNVRKVPAADKKTRVDQALDTVQMGTYRDRFPNQLSGGQQQRVALARALVIEPDVLLFDEPLSNLDAKLRLEMRAEIKRIHDQTGITTLYVTHDQKEALSMAGRMAVMEAGVIMQTGTPHEVYHFPRTRAIAEFIGEANILPGSVQGQTGARAYTMATAVGPLEACAAVAVHAGQKVECLVRPEAIQLVKGPGNNLTGQVCDVTYLGETEQLIIQVGECRLKVVQANPRGAYARGAQVSLSFPVEQTVILTP
jgi:iron(III) transport system ATP-binding protein